MLAMQLSTTLVISGIVVATDCGGSQAPVALEQLA